MTILLPAPSKIMKVEEGGTTREPVISLRGPTVDYGSVRAVEVVGGRAQHGSSARITGATQSKTAQSCRRILNNV